MLELGFLWLIFCFVVAYGAANRNRSGLAWFFISVLFSPIVAAMFLLILGEDKD
jgi:hypothetical protein